jgi:hypothetical protein
MNSNKTTHNDSVRRDLEAIEQERLGIFRKAITFDVQPAVGIDHVASQDGEVDYLPVCEATIDPDTFVAEVRPASDMDVLGGIRPEQTIDAEGFERIRDVLADQLAKGLKEPKTITFTGQTVKDYAEDSIVHPAWCKTGERDRCWTGFALDMIEHESTIEKLTTESFTAEALLTVKTDHYRYTHDVHREEIAQITVVNKDIGVAEMIKGTPADLKELGQFIIEQANRFEEYVNDVSEV